MEAWRGMGIDGFWLLLGLLFLVVLLLAVGIVVATTARRRRPRDAAPHEPPLAGDPEDESFLDGEFAEQGSDDVGDAPAGPRD